MLKCLQMFTILLEFSLENLMWGRKLKYICVRLVLSWKWLKMGVLHIECLLYLFHLLWIGLKFLIITHLFISKLVCCLKHKASTYSVHGAPIRLWGQMGTKAQPCSLLPSHLPWRAGVSAGRRKMCFCFFFNISPRSHLIIHDEKSSFKNLHKDDWQRALDGDHIQELESLRITSSLIRRLGTEL